MSAIWHFISHVVSSIKWKRLLRDQSSPSFSMTQTGFPSLQASLSLSLFLFSLSSSFASFLRGWNFRLGDSKTYQTWRISFHGFFFGGGRGRWWRFCSIGRDWANNHGVRRLAAAKTSLSKSSFSILQEPKINCCQIWEKLWLFLVFLHREMACVVINRLFSPSRSFPGWTEYWEIHFSSVKSRSWPKFAKHQHLFHCALPFIKLSDEPIDGFCIGERWECTFWVGVAGTLREAVRLITALYCDFFLWGGRGAVWISRWPPLCTSLPTTNCVVCKIEAQSEYVHIAYTFLHVWRRFVCSVSAY